MSHLNFKCSKMDQEACPGFDFISPLKKASLNINNDFLEEGVCYGPALSPYISTHRRFHIASRL